MEPLIRIANDRDLWLGKIADSRLWQGLVTVCGHWGTMMRLAENPSHVLTQAERLAAESFVADQEDSRRCPQSDNPYRGRAFICL